MNRWQTIAFGAVTSMVSFAAAAPSPSTAPADQARPAGTMMPAGEDRRGGGGPGRPVRAGPVVPPGPPAPVPPEVMMLRPTADDVNRINAALRRFVETNTSADAELLRKYAPLINVPLPRDNPCIRPAPSARGNRHAALVERAKKGDFDIMLIGDSITELLSAERDPFGNPGGKAAMVKHFSGARVANFGVSGDTTQGVLWGLQNGEGQDHKPKAIMLMIGTNNAGGASGPEIAEGIGADVLELRKEFPDARILLLAIFPRGAGPTDANRLKIEEANSTGGIFVERNGKSNIADTQVATFRYPEFDVVWQHRTWGAAPDPKYQWAVTIYGDRGTLKASPQSYDFVPEGRGDKIHRDCVVEREQFPEDVTEPKIDLQGAPATRAHMKDFLAAVGSRGKPLADIEQGHISTAACILANVSMGLGGRALSYDPVRRQVPGDTEATKLLRRPFRGPWVHPADNMG